MWVLQDEASSPEIFHFGLWWLSVLTAVADVHFPEMWSGFPSSLCAPPYLLFADSQDGFFVRWDLISCRFGRRSSCDN